MSIAIIKRALGSLRKEGMKRLYQIKLVIFKTHKLLLFLGCTYVILTTLNTRSVAVELLSVSPENAICGQKVTIKAGALDKTQSYSITIACGSLECTNPPEFTPVSYTVPAGSVSFLKDETFKIGEECDQGLVAAQAGEYTIKLYNAGIKKELAVQKINLVSNNSTGCILSTGKIAQSSVPQQFKLTGAPSCTYKLSVLTPNGVRQTLPEIKTLADGVFSANIPASLLTIAGTYRLTGIADSTCTSVTGDARECKSATFTIGTGSCTFSKEDTASNCEQCPTNQICSLLNECTADEANKCNSENLKQESENDKTAENSVNVVQNAKLNIIFRFFGGSIFMEVGMIVLLVISALIGYKGLVKRYKR